jgi:hypothetical protein
MTTESNSTLEVLRPTGDAAEWAKRLGMDEVQPDCTAGSVTRRTRQVVHLQRNKTCLSERELLDEIARLKIEIVVDWTRFYQFAMFEEADRLETEHLRLQDLHRLLSAGDYNNDPWNEMKILLLQVFALHLKAKDQASGTNTSDRSSRKPPSGDLDRSFSNFSQHTDGGTA